jgi:hypothetical protein
MAAGGKLDAERFAAFVGRTLRIDGCLKNSRPARRGP